MKKHTILCVDDEVDNVEALERLFRKKYHVVKATSGQEALDIIENFNGDISLIITDQRMPEMTGVEFLEKTIPEFPDTIRILLTGYTDLESVITAVNQGQIYRYLTKPWDPMDLSHTVDRAIERYEMSLELKKKNSELAQALQELQTLDQAKSNFMILINHELKTPLTSILNFGSLLEETKLDEDQKKYLSRIRNSSHRLKDLVEDVLVIMRAETGQIKIENQKINLNQIVQNIEKMLSPQLSQKNQTFHFSDHSMTVQSSDYIMTQVLQRLLQNAVKFGYANEPIHFEVSDKGGLVQIKITNKGPQISEKVSEKIFKPFFIDENIMNHTTGSGLGLTVCQSLLKNIESGINIKNNPDGVSVYFEIKG